MDEDQQEYIKKKAVAIYSRTLDQIKPDCLKMVYDSYCNYQFHLENESLVNPKNKKEDLKLYEKGFEGDKWFQKIQPILSQNSNPSPRKRKLSISTTIVNTNFIKDSEIPKKPTSQKLTKFTFKSQKIIPDFKTLALTKAAKLDFDKIGRQTFDFISEILEEVYTLHINDYSSEKANSIIHLDRFKIEYKPNDINKENPKIIGNVDLKTFTKRADILVNSRFNFIEKYIETMCKFLVALKKLVKKRKEKEIEQNKTKQNNIVSEYNSRILQDSPFFDEKFVKLKEEIIDGEKEIIKKDLNANKLKNILKIKATEISESKRKNELELIKSKITKIIKKLNNEELIEEDKKEKKVIFDNNNEKEKYVNSQGSFKFGEDIHNINNKQKHGHTNSSHSKERSKEKRLKNDLLDKVKEKDKVKYNDTIDNEKSKENRKEHKKLKSEILEKNITPEKTETNQQQQEQPDEEDVLVIIPKKKIDHLGLKLYIQESLSKNK